MSGKERRKKKTATKRRRVRNRSLQSHHQPALSPSTKKDVDKEQKVKQELIKMSRIVRIKFKDLKKDTDNMERYLETSTKPFVSPIVEGIKRSMPLPMLDVKQTIKQETKSPKR